MWIIHQISFESFMKFEPAIKGNLDRIMELKIEPLQENVSYIETQLSTIQQR
jgi:hypothetical protein